MLVIDLPFDGQTECWTDVWPQIRLKILEKIPLPKDPASVVLGYCEPIMEFKGQRRNVKFLDYDITVHIEFIHMRLLSIQTSEWNLLINYLDKITWFGNNHTTGVIDFKSTNNVHCQLIIYDNKWLMKHSGFMLTYDGQGLKMNTNTIIIMNISKS